jgi:flagellar FliJ protein
MKRFHFSLEKVLELRRYREQETKIELGRAIGMLSDIENNIKALALDRHRAAGERFARENSTADILAWDTYIMRLDQTRDRLLEDAAKAEQIVEEKRAAYIEASRDRKVIDTLKEKRQKEYRKEKFADEMRELDDVSGGARAREAAKG